MGSFDGAMIHFSVVACGVCCGLCAAISCLFVLFCLFCFFVCLFCSALTGLIPNPYPLIISSVFNVANNSFTVRDHPFSERATQIAQDGGGGRDAIAFCGRC
jgi:hypothetical protein